MRRLLALVVVAGLVGAAAYVLYVRDAFRGPGLGPTATVTRGTLEETVDLTGVIASSAVRNLTFGTAGTVETVRVKLGDTLTADQVIARLDTVALDAQLAAARDALAAARAALELVEAEPPSPPPGAPEPMPTTETQHDAARTQARAAIGSAEAAIAAAEAAIRGSEIRAPVAGTVTRLRLAVGDRVVPNPVVPDAAPVQVMDLDALQVHAQASESDVVRIRVGQPATLTFDALPDVSLAAEVCEIERAGVVVEGVPLYPVRVCLAAQDPRVRVGLTAVADVRINRLENVLLVPSAAVTTSGPGHMVRVVVAENQVLETRVIVGTTANGQTEIVEGLSEGQQVLLPAES